MVLSPLSANPFPSFYTSTAGKKNADRWPRTRVTVDADESFPLRNASTNIRRGTAGAPDSVPTAGAFPWAVAEDEELTGG